MAVSTSDFPQFDSAGQLGENPFDSYSHPDSYALFEQMKAEASNQDYLANKENAFNAWALGKQMEYNSLEADKQRAYSTYMSNTAFRRAAADLRAAGFNPALALGSSASTPSSASPSASAVSSSRASGLSNAYSFLRELYSKREGYLMRFLSSAFGLMLLS